MPAMKDAQFKLPVKKYEMKKKYKNQEAAPSWPESV